MSEEATVTEKKVKVQIKDNPRDMYYMRGQQTRDHLKARIEALNAGYEDPDPIKVQEFLKTLRVEDVVGIDDTAYKVTEVNLDDCSLMLQNMTKRGHPAAELGLDQIGFAIACGFAEILYRDDKPYGIELEKEYTIKIVKHNKSEEEDAGNGTDEEAEDDS